MKEVRSWIAYILLHCFIRLILIEISVLTERSKDCKKLKI